MLCAVVCKHGLDPAIKLEWTSRCTSILHDSDRSPLFYAETSLSWLETDVKQCSLPPSSKQETKETPFGEMVFITVLVNL